MWATGDTYRDLGQKDHRVSLTVIKDVRFLKIHGIKIIKHYLVRYKFYAVSLCPLSSAEPSELKGMEKDEENTEGP